MAVRRRGKKWMVDVRLPNGDRVRRSIGTKREAEEVQRQLVADLVEGNLPTRPSTDMTFADFISICLDEVKTNKAARTY